MSAPTFLFSFPWHVSPGPASGACSPVLFPFSPIQNFLVGWGMGITTALADGFSSSLQCLPWPPTHLPSPLSSVSGTPPGSWPEPPIPLGQQTDCFPLDGFGSLSSLVARTLCGCGILPKATSESRQEKQRPQGRLKKKNFNFFLFVDVLILINHLFPPSCSSSSSSSSSFCSSSLKRARTGNYTRSSTELGANPPPPPPYPAHT